MISAGFVSEGNDSLYVEVEENFWRPHASEFVLDVVKPLLSGNGLPAHEAAAKIVGWIRGRGPDVTLVSDSDWDRKVLLKHLRHVGYCRPLWQWAKVPQDLPGNLRRAFNNAYLEWFLRSGHPQHHALYDAEALRYADQAARSADE